MTTLNELVLLAKPWLNQTLRSLAVSFVTLTSPFVISTAQVFSVVILFEFKAKLSAVNLEVVKTFLYWSIISFTTFV